MTRSRTQHAPLGAAAAPLFARVGPALFIFLAATLVNLNTLTHGWALDDTLLITQNTFTQQGFAGIPSIWSNDVFTGYFGQGGVEPGGRYRPLSQTVFAACYSLFGPDPFIGHLLNVLLYALTCVLLFRLLDKALPRTSTQQPWASIPFLAALIYALHPLHVEVVANIKSLDEILAMLFSLVACWHAWRSTHTHRTINLLISAVAFFLALCAKENAITFLAIVPLVLFYITGNTRSAVTPTLVLLVPAGLYFMLRSGALGPAPGIAPIHNFLTDPFFGAGFAERSATVMVTWWKYLGLIIYPHPLTTDHYPGMIPVVGWNDMRAWLALTIFTGAGLYACLRVRTRSVPAFGILWFLITFSVVSNLFIDLGTPMNDRFLFMPLAGACVLAAAGMSRFMTLPSERIAWIGRIGMVLLLLAFAGKTFSRNRDWKDDLTLFTRDVLVSNKSARCHVMVGKIIYEAAGEKTNAHVRDEYLRRAEEHLKRGLAIYPDYFQAWGVLGVMELDRKNYRGSMDLFLRCLAIQPKEPVVLANMGFIGRKMVAAKDTEGAAQAFRALLHFDPTQRDPYLSLADLFMRSGKADSSIILLDKLLIIDPNNASAHRMKGEIHAVYLNDVASAESEFRRALELDPNNVSILGNLGAAAFNRNDPQEALSFFLRAVELDPQNAALLMNVSKAQRALGNEALAAEYALRAQQAAAVTPAK